MAEQTIVRAELIELKDDLSDVLPNGKRVPVQFNPETLKLSYANQIQAQNNGASGASAGSGGRGAGNQSQGTAARQFVGAGTTKLAVQLTFDVSAATGDAFLDAEGQQQSGDVFMVDDVRRVTALVLYFIKPKDPGAGAKDASQRVPPGVRFLWGKFLFDGIVESLEENVEFFAADGRALRAGVTLNLIQQSILVPAFTGDGRVTRPGAGGAGPGAVALAPARSGQSLQQMSDGMSGGAASLGARIGVSASIGVGAGFAASPGAAFGAGGWQRIAAANGIENPRALAPGQFIDLGAQKPRITTG